MNISEEAVEAAARAMVAAEGFELKPQHVAGDVYRAIARKALEASAPYLMDFGGAK